MKDNNISEELLKQVNGGGSGESCGEDDGSGSKNRNGGCIIGTTTKYCRKCNEITAFNVYSGDRKYCTMCNTGSDE